VTDQSEISCPNGHQVPVNAGAGKFCQVCGASLLKRCPVGHLSRATGPFCGTCGASMETVPPAPAAAPIAASIAAAQESTAFRDDPVETRPIPAVRDTAGEDAGAGPSGHRSGGPWLVVAVVAIVVVLGLAGGLVFALRSGHSAPKKAALSVTTEPSHSASRQRTTTTTTTTTSSTTSSVPSEQQEAQALSALLTQSVTDRSSINAASGDMSACGPDLLQDQQIFTTAEASRQTLLSQLSMDSGFSALPALMVTALHGAWQASEQVDEDYATWASDEVSNGCTPDDTSDPNYEAAVTPNQTATQDKMAFASAWDPIATTYNLPTYQWDQL